MKTLIDTRIYALLSHNESNLLELTQAYKEFIEIMTEMIANCNDRDEILRILHYGRIEFERSRNCWSLLLPFIKAELSCSVIIRLVLSKLSVH